MRSPIAILVISGMMIGCAHSGRTQLRSVGEPADSQTGRWESVEGLSVGTRVSVAQVGGDTINGKIVAVNADRLVVLSRGAAREVPRTAVRRVVVITGMDRSTGAKGGFLVGAGAGAFVAGATVQSNRGPWMLLLSTGWGALGAMFGALGTQQESQVVYEMHHHTRRASPSPARELSLGSRERQVSDPDGHVLRFGVESRADEPLGDRLDGQGRRWIPQPDGSWRPAE